MSRARAHGAALLTAGLTALSAVGCGSDDEPRPLPQRDAAFLLAQLDEVDRRVASRACVDVKRGTLTRIENRIDRLPDDVDQDVRTAVQDSVENLRGLVDEQCKQRRRPKPPPTIPDFTPEPEPTTTAPETTTTEPETTTEEEPPPEEDGGDEKGKGGGGGGGNGNGNGNGGGANVPDAGAGGGAAPPSGVLTPADPAGSGEADG